MADPDFAADEETIERITEDSRRFVIPHDDTLTLAAIARKYQREIQHLRTHCLHGTERSRLCIPCANEVIVTPNKEVE